MDRYPIAYIRRSFIGADDASREVQEAAVRDLAHHDGETRDLRIIDDWNHPTDGAAGVEPGGFASLLEDVEAGRVSAVYAYALDRLYPSTRSFVRLTDAALAHDARVATSREGVLAGDGSPAAQAFERLTAVLSGLEVHTARARARQARDARLQRGDALGPAPYGYRYERRDGHVIRVPDPEQPIEPILAAYREAGSVLGACKLLEERGVRAPRGGTRWATSLVTRIIEANAPGTLPHRTLNGRRQPSTAILAQLLRCPFCGRMMTPNTSRGQYYCANGPRQRETHARYSVTERDLMPWVKAEAARFRFPADVIEMDAANAAERDRLAAKRERILDLYADGAIRDKADRDRRLAAVEADLEAVVTKAVPVDIPHEIEWDAWTPAQINAVLRTYWTSVDLGPDLEPIGAVWRLPSEYID